MPSVTSACVTRPIPTVTCCPDHARRFSSSLTIFWNTRLIPSQCGRRRRCSTPSALFTAASTKPAATWSPCAINHAPAVMPFCIAGKPIIPVFHLGAAIGEDTPFWDQHDEFGDTNLLVVKPEEGRSLARALGQNSIVLMNRHGATVVGASLKELVARSIFMCQNADYQRRAIALGKPEQLHRGEIRLAGTLSRMPNVVSRTWEYWTMRLEASGAMPPRRSVGKTARRTMPKSARATARDRRKGRRR